MIAKSVIHTCCSLQPVLHSDWLSFISRPWVQGPVDAILGNTQFADMMVQHTELKAAVDNLLTTIDTALTQVGGWVWLDSHSVYAQTCLIFSPSQLYALITTSDNALTKVGG